MQMIIYFQKVHKTCYWALYTMTKDESDDDGDGSLDNENNHHYHNLYSLLAHISSIKCCFFYSVPIPAVNQPQEENSSLSVLQTSRTDRS